MSERDNRSGESERTAAGVDVTLIDEMLRMTVRQRLEQNDRAAALAVRLQGALEAGKGRDGWKKHGS